MPLRRLRSLGIELLCLRLSPEDDAHNESFMDPQAFLELPCPVW